MLPIKFTLFTSKTILSKSFDVENAALVKTPSAAMFAGRAKRITCDFSEFPAQLAALTSHQATGYGITDSASIRVVKKGKEIPGSSISRSLEYFQYQQHVPGVLMIDIDNPKLPRQAIIQILRDVIPGFDQAARLVRGSVSGGVSFRGEALVSPSFHIYFPMQDSSLIPIFGKSLFKKLWLAGHGFITLAANGAQLVRTIIDGAVFSPERLDFTGAPDIRHEDLIWTPPVTEYVDGGYLDLSLLLAEGVADDKYTSLVASAKQGTMPESTTKKTTWIASRVAEMGGEDEAFLSAMEKGETFNLPPSFILHFATHGRVTVAEALADKKRFDKASLADPIEGVEYGRTTATFYANDDKPVIHSFAHNANWCYFLNGGDLDALVAKFNETHARVIIGARHRIMRTTDDGLEFIDQDDLTKLYQHTKIKIGQRDDGRSIFTNHVTAWAKHPKCKVYTGGVVFSPGRTVTPDYYNTWQGFSVAPRQNDELGRLVYRHIEEIICGGDARLIAYFYNWVASILQHPSQPAGSALVVRGEKGCGKGTIGHFLARLWGKHALHLSNPKHLIGSFNGHLNDVCFLFADEAFFSGDKQHESVLKALITEPTLMIERKGIDAIQQPNYLKVFMATNADFAVPASRDERRYCVFDASSQRINDFPYFEALRDECNDPQVKAAFLHRMLTRDLSHFRVGEIPDSVGLKEQRVHSLGSAGKWLLDSLANGYFMLSQNTETVWTDTVPSKELYASYILWCDTAKVGEHGRLTQTAFGTYLNKVGFYSYKVSSIHRRLGDLPSAIAKFEQYERVKITSSPTHDEFYIPF